MATHSSIIAWTLPTDRGAGQDTVHGVAKRQTPLSEHEHARRCYCHRCQYDHHGVHSAPGVRKALVPHGVRSAGPREAKGHS